MNKVKYKIEIPIYIEQIQGTGIAKHIGSTISQIELSNDNPNFETSTNNLIKVHFKQHDPIYIDVYDLFNAANKCKTINELNGNSEFDTIEFDSPFGG